MQSMSHFGILLKFNATYARQCNLHIRLMETWIETHNFSMEHKIFSFTRECRWRWISVQFHFIKETICQYASLAQISKYCERELVFARIFDGIFIPYNFIHYKMYLKHNTPFNIYDKSATLKCMATHLKRCSIISHQEAPRYSTDSIEAQ